MNATARPADVVVAVCTGVSRLVCGGLDDAQREEQLDRLAALYADSTDVRHPFSPLGDTPLRSRADLRHHFSLASSHTQGAERFEPVVVRVHQTADPEVDVVELNYEGIAHGRPFSIPLLMVTRVRDGVIVESRDYSDHVSFARAFGRLDALTGALTASAT
jgi:uncharacterized protein